MCKRCIGVYRYLCIMLVIMLMSFQVAAISEMTPVVSEEAENAAIVMEGTFMRFTNILWL